MTKGEKIGAFFLGLLLFLGLGYAIYDSIYSPRANIGRLSDYEDNLFPDQLDLDEEEEEPAPDEDLPPPPPSEKKPETTPANKK